MSQILLSRQGYNDVLTATSQEETANSWQDLKKTQHPHNDLGIFLI